MRADERTRTLLRERLPKDWDSPLGRVEVDSITPMPQGTGVHVRLRPTDFPVDPNGYDFVNPPVGVRGLQIVKRRPIEAFRSIVTDAAVHYVRRGKPHNTTLTVFSTAADGEIFTQDQTYADAREGVNTTFTVNTTEVSAMWAGQIFATPDYFISEAFFNFDTSSIPDTDTIDDATFSLFGDQDASTTDFTVRARLFDWGGTLTSADWVAGSALSTKTLLATFATSGGWSTVAYNAFTSDAAFVNNVSKTGVTYIMTSSSRHEDGTAPTGAERVSCFTANEAGTTKDPKLVVNHTAAVAGGYTHKLLLTGVGG